MAEYVDFHYLPLEGKISGLSMLKQTEDAINDLGEKVYSIEVDADDIQQALDNSEQAIDTANTALATVTTNRAVWFNNVADMVDADLDVGVVAATKGYYLPNDGGNGFYTIRTRIAGDTENGGSIIFLDNGTTAELITDKKINVRQFGAKCDGVSDDTTAIQNAINALPDNGILYFPKGTYVVTPTGSGYILSLPTVHNIEIKGDGIESTIKIAPVNETYTGIIGVRCDNELYVHDISFDHNCDNNIPGSFTSKGRYTISNHSLVACKQYKIENINVVNCDSVVSVYLTMDGNNNYADNVLITNCKWIDAINGGTNLNYDQSYLNIRAKEFIATNNFLCGKSWDSGTPRTAIEVHSDTSVIANNVVKKFLVGGILCNGKPTAENLIWSNNSFSVSRNGLFIWPIKEDNNLTIGMENVKIFGNVFNMHPNKYCYTDTYTFLSAIAFYTSANFLAIKNIQIENNIINYPADVGNSSYTSVSGSTSWGAIQARLTTAPDKHIYNLSIKNNEIINSAYCGLLLEQVFCNGTVITGNRFRNCSSYNQYSTATSSIKDMPIYLHTTLESDLVFSDNIIEDFNAPTPVTDYIFVRDDASTPTHYFQVHDNQFNFGADTAISTTVDYLATQSNSVFVKFSGSVPSATAPRLPVQYSNKGMEVTVGKDRYIKTDDTSTAWKSVQYDTAAPNSGSHKIGDIVYNNAPSAGGNIGWVCTTAGTPGTWKAFGEITA